jgi:hypothetical protein
MTTPDDRPPPFGYDALDTLALGYWPPFGLDVVDIIEGREHGIPTRCTQCGQAWLMGPEALAAGLCWGCRTNGSAS